MLRAFSAFLAAFRGLFPDRASRPRESNITLVALLTSNCDRELLSRLADDHGWTVHFTQSSGDAWRTLTESKAPIFLCEREVPGVDWRDVIRKMVSAPHQVRAILISNVADAYLWNEVFRWGGHDVLTTPFREDNVVRAIRLAWLYSNSSPNTSMKNHLGAA